VIKFVSFYLLCGLFLAPFNHSGMLHPKHEPKRMCKVKTINGIVEGIIDSNGIRSFKGIPYAQPPVGDLRWQPPQPVKNWKGIRKTLHFGPRPMQNLVYSDMIFRSKKMSEDCLYLNIWVPVKREKTLLPVLVYFYGGGFMAGDGSEPRYDGESMARKGIIMITVNYRLDVFGFLALPSLTTESAHHASGDYGLLDQRAALLWVRKNISAFGGNPHEVTIAGQSAGSMSVSAQMASSLSKGLFVRAIGESGSVLGNLVPLSLAVREQQGIRFMKMSGAKNLTELKEISADSLLKISANPGCPHFGPTIDGYFLPESPEKIYYTGLQANVPLLAGWNSAEINYHSLLGKEAPTPSYYKKIIQGIFGKYAEAALKLYPGATKEEVIRSATDLASDRFIAYATWKWIDIHSKTDGKPVYRYFYSHSLPPLRNDSAANEIRLLGAPHSAEIPYALGNLYLIKTYDWTKTDYHVSAIMQDYFVNFIKTGNPNAPGLPEWPWLQSSIPKVMVIDNHSEAVPEKNQRRYLFLDEFYHNN
jgi:para-nitrobenzyl esterase